MNSVCRKHEDSLLARAEATAQGGAFASADLDAHLSGCPACAQRLAEIARLLSVAPTPRHHAPEGLIARAIGLAPERPVRAGLRWLQPAIALRTEALPRFEASVDGFQIELSLERSGPEVRVSGRLPGADWRAEAPDGRVETSGRRFAVVAPAAARSGFFLFGPDSAVEIPPVSEWPIPN